jgi:hypothetical protein
MIHRFVDAHAARARARFPAAAAAAVVVSLAGLVACGGSEPPPKTAAVSPGGSKDPSSWPKDDHTMCDWRNKPELEISEIAGPGAMKPNVRRVYKPLGESEGHRRVLVCREIDTNLDGIKDVVRMFNDKGEALKEEADTDYDGRIDVWIAFVDGRIAEENLDTNHDGRPDVWKVYSAGLLSRVKRDRNLDGQPDVWEIYAKGRLERMGIDESYDGHVDRWDRDLVQQAQAEAAEAQARDALGAKTGADAGAPSR